LIAYLTILIDPLFLIIISTTISKTNSTLNIITFVTLSPFLAGSSKYYNI